MNVNFSLEAIQPEDTGAMFKTARRKGNHQPRILYPMRASQEQK